METKRLSAAITKTAGQDKTYTAILSMPTLDRDGEIIDGKAFEPLPEHITIDIDHGMSVATTVGSGTPYYEGDVLKVDFTFSSVPLAQVTKTLVDEGHIRHMSVAYMSANYVPDDDGVPHMRKGELLNSAITGIPSNREAAILAAKAFGAKNPPATWGDQPHEKTGARHSSKDAAAIQTIFDHVVALGAVCPGCAEKSAPTGEHKSADTNPEPAAAQAAAAPAEVDVARGLAALALAQAELALS